MQPVINSENTIINAAVLTCEVVVHKRVLCPICGSFVFEMWPEGWDAHAAGNGTCRGLSAVDAEEKKQEFKDATKYLFRP